MNEDRVFLKVPAKPEYIMVIRLTTSAVASRAGFGVDEIEDIKVAVAEAGIVIMNQHKGTGNIDLSFKIIGDEGIRIHICASDVKEKIEPFIDNEQTELSFYIMESFMDGIEKKEENGYIRELIMYKKFGG
ncbi:MAG: hypothetical protein GX094_01740 [Clostridiales bacterium]|jgi:serine/threonine-protein kinase RsbW|nr:hypothetical protein [Clostridiales bacterium]